MPTAAAETIEHDLITRATEGDRDALSQLLYDQYDRLTALINKKIPPVLSPWIQADDVLQDTFVLAFRSIDRLEDRGAEAFAAWLETLATNRLRDLLKADRRQKRGGGRRHVPADAARRSSMVALVEKLAPDANASPSQCVARGEAVRAVEIAIAELPEDQRAAIHLRYIDQLSLEQTADELHRSPAAIRGLVHRAKQSLRQALGRSTRWFYRK